MTEPRELATALLAALGASDGRRRRRKRDTTADAIGLGLKRELLERIVRDAPAGDDLEAWLAAEIHAMVAAGEAADGAVRAMAREILEEWRMAAASPSFREWLARGAPSEDGEA